MKSIPDVHMPWDRGVIDASMKALFGVGSLHKTVKTICGARVPVARAVVEGVTCPACCAELRRLLEQVEAVAVTDARFVKAANDERDFFKRACSLL